MNEYIFKTYKSYFDIKNNPFNIIPYIIMGIIIILIIVNMAMLALILGLLNIPIAIYARWKDSKRKYYSISFNENDIITMEDAQEKQILYSNIRQIKIHFRNIKGDVVVPMRAPSLGDGNTIKILLSNNQKIVRYVLCETNADFFRLKLLGRFLEEEKGINIKMSGFEN